MSAAADPAGRRGRAGLSFEFFPPKTDEGRDGFDSAVTRLAALRPRFVSVTYGAGGTSQARSVTAVQRILDRSEMPVAALKRAGAADVTVSAYPERHPQSPDWRHEIDTLKRKVDAGADRAVTQFFFETALFEQYLERVRRAGIGIPVVPGIMPIGRFSSVRRFAERCGASVPAWLAEQFEGVEEDSPVSTRIAVEVAARQIGELAALGMDQYHFYTLNRADLCERICSVSGLSGTRRVAA